VNLGLPPKPRLRGWFHEIAFFVSIPAGIALIARREFTEFDTAERLSTRGEE
jgi:hypothetical protein